MEEYQLKEINLEVMELNESVITFSEFNRSYIGMRFDHIIIKS
jgi:hypothetical protein